MFRLQRIRLLLLAALLFLPLPATAIDASAVDDCFHTPSGLYLTPVEAYRMKLEAPQQVLLVDVRTRAEVQYVGFTEFADANIPLMFQPGNYEWQADSKDPAIGNFRKSPNPDFVKAVERLVASRGLDRDAPVIVMCAAGKRSTAAARALHAAGYTRVYNLYEGFEGFKATEGYFKGQRVVNGWKNSTLPWGYRLPQSKMYFNFAP